MLRLLILAMVLVGEVSGQDLVLVKPGEPAPFAGYLYSKTAALQLNHKLDRYEQLKVQYEELRQLNVQATAKYEQRLENKQQMLVAEQKHSTSYQTLADETQKVLRTTRREVKWYRKKEKIKSWGLTLFGVLTGSWPAIVAGQL